MVIGMKNASVYLAVIVLLAICFAAMPMVVHGADATYPSDMKVSINNTCLFVDADNETSMTYYTVDSGYRWFYATSYYYNVNLIISSTTSSNEVLFSTFGNLSLQWQCDVFNGASSVSINNVRTWVGGPNVNFTGRWAFDTASTWSDP